MTKITFQRLDEAMSNVAKEVEQLLEDGFCGYGLPNGKPTIYFRSTIEVVDFMQKVADLPGDSLLKQTMTSLSPATKVIGVMVEPLATRQPMPQPV